MDTQKLIDDIQGAWRDMDQINAKSNEYSLVSFKD